MSHSVDSAGVVYDYPSGVRIGVVDRARGGILLDEDVYRDDGRFADEPTCDVLTRVADIGANIRPLVLDLLADNTGNRTLRLRELGKHLATLSKLCLARADEAECHAGRNPAAGAGIERVRGVSRSRG